MHDGRRVLALKAEQGGGGRTEVEVVLDVDVVAVRQRLQRPCVAMVAHLPCRSRQQCERRCRQWAAERAAGACGDAHQAAAVTAADAVAHARSSGRKRTTQTHRKRQRLGHYSGGSHCRRRDAPAEDSGERRRPARSVIGSTRGTPAICDTPAAKGVARVLEGVVVKDGADPPTNVANEGDDG